MKYKSLLSAVLTPAVCIVFAAGCNEPGDVSGTVSDTVMTCATGAVTTLLSDEPSETSAAEETPLEKAFRLAEGIGSESSFSNGYFLLDMNLDGIPEFMEIHPGDFHERIIRIYRLDGDSPSGYLSGEWSGLSLMDESVLSLYYDKIEDRYFFISVCRNTYLQGVTYCTMDKLSVCGDGLYAETIGSQDVYTANGSAYSSGIIIGNKQVRAPGFLSGGIGEADEIFLAEAEKYLGGYELVREYDIKAACEELYSVGDKPKAVILDGGYSDFPRETDFIKAKPDDIREYVYISDVRYDINSYHAEVIVDDEYYKTDFKELNKMPNLASLSISFYNNSPQDVDLSGLYGIKNLKSLSLKGNSNDENPLRLNPEVLSELTELQEFYMYYIDAELDFISRLTNLKIVGIEQYNHPEAGYFSPLYNLTGLEIMLHNEAEALNTQEQREAIAENMPRLTQIRYNYY